MGEGVAPTVLDLAYRDMTALAADINEMKRRHEAAVRVQELLGTLEDYPGPDLTRLGDIVLEVILCTASCLFLSLSVFLTWTNS